MPDAPAAAAPESIAEEGHDKVRPLRLVRERADAVGGWAQDKAKALADTAKEKPLAAAGVGAGAAFAAGLLFGLLLSQAFQPAPRTWRDRVMDLKPDW